MSRRKRLATMFLVTAVIAGALYVSWSRFIYPPKKIDSGIQNVSWSKLIHPPKKIDSGIQTKNIGKVSVNTEKPVQPEKNPPGDIPDSQVFIKFTQESGGYELKVPEGWARTINGVDVRFADKFDGITVAVSTADVPPTVENVRDSQVRVLRMTERAVKITSVSGLKLAHADAIVIAYESNSAPDPITDKQIRLEDKCYLFYRDGKVAALTLWAPLGADNVDQWRLISNSFRWR